MINPGDAGKKCAWSNGFFRFRDLTNKAENGKLQFGRNLQTNPEPDHPLLQSALLLTELHW
jgi:hypothetical protein